MDLLSDLPVVIILLSVLSQICSSQLFDVSADITSAELGEEFTFKCTIVNSAGVNAERINLHILRKDGHFGDNIDDGELVVSQTLENNLSPSDNGTIANTLDDRNRLTYDGQTFTLTVSGAGCDDNLVQYRCVSTYNIAGLPFPFSAKAARQLEVKARPQPPRMLNYPRVVEESMNVYLACEANVGFPYKGTIEWRITAAGESSDVLAVTDPRVITTSRSGDPSCTNILRSTLFFENIDRSYQNFAVTCFVTNDDFQPNVPQECADPDRDMCMRSDPISILYPVIDVKITQNQADPYETGSVTLTCACDSFPQPTFDWVKVDDESRALAVMTEGSVSKLRLTNLNVTSDAGEYNCTATNSYNSRIFSATSTFMLTITSTTLQPITITTTNLDFTTATTKPPINSTITNQNITTATTKLSKNTTITNQNITTANTNQAITTATNTQAITTTATTESPKKSKGLWGFFAVLFINKF